AGTTGSGKSVCINALVASMLFRFTPEELRFIMIDPKMVEMQVYNSLPHLALPVVVDLKKVLLALRWLIDEMERRYNIFAQAGIDLIVATQTPRADVITGGIKANIPSRIAFQVASKIDSRVILDENGADRLLGQGDMLYLPPSASRLIRAQGVLVTDDEIRRLVEFVSAQSPPAFDTEMQEKLQSVAPPEEEVTEEDEELVEKCLEIIRQEKRASTSLLQRRLRLGYTRAARIVDILEQRGILGPGEGAKPREILVDLDAAV